MANIAQRTLIAFARWGLHQLPVVDVGVRYVWLKWWEWAQREQQHKDAAHPDLPRIIQRVAHIRAGGPLI